MESRGNSSYMIRVATVSAFRNRTKSNFYVIQPENTIRIGNLYSNSNILITNLEALAFFADALLQWPPYRYCVDSRKAIILTKVTWSCDLFTSMVYNNLRIRLVLGFSVLTTSPGLKFF
ncbi:unnamed protein product [Microthlaspi erraticum]|uniref:Uncharacterized protein n=1 Tax=Microthlaspi erraticum TaxID=1685480 RepID=A0A6D2HXC1_9BRAS|nr:unnamed protein product [Microthlaspi erraticum]